jgi:hypothetical protein
MKTPTLTVMPDATAEEDRVQRTFATTQWRLGNMIFLASTARNALLANDPAKALEMLYELNKNAAAATELLEEYVGE